MTEYFPWALDFFLYFFFESFSCWSTTSLSWGGYLLASMGFFLVLGSWFLVLCSYPSVRPFVLLFLED